MNKIKIPGLAVALLFGLGTLVANAEELSGKITETGFNKYKVDVKGTERMVYTGKSSQFAPNTWRPEVGDEVKFDTVASKSRSGAAILEVITATLVKANPNSLTKLTSPITVTIIESGISGIRAKTDAGQEIRFDVNRRSLPTKVPTGWVEASGDKAIITFHAQAQRFTGKATLVADKIEKAK